MIEQSPEGLRITLPSDLFQQAGQPSRVGDGPTAVGILRHACLPGLDRFASGPCGRGVKGSVHASDYDCTALTDH